MKRAQGRLARVRNGRRRQANARLPGVLYSNEDELLSTRLSDAPASIPEMTHAGRVLRLQTLVGNRAVSAAVKNPVNPMLLGRGTGARLAPLLQVQRAAGGSPPAQSAALDAELDAILAKIPAPPQVPMFEAITSTTAGEYSYTDWEEAMQAAWKRENLTFTGAARKLAEQPGPGRPVSARSPTVQPQAPYAKRWILNLIATTYRRRKPLAHVANFLKKGSPFEKAQSSEADRVLNVNEPSGEEMKTQIYDAILALSALLPEGRVGELVVYFSGHGGEGRIYGVDWKRLTPSQLQSIAEFARDWGVHIVYVLDSCRAGGITLLPQAGALFAAGEKINKLPPQQRKAANAKISLARVMGSLAYSMNAKTMAASEIVRYIKSYTPENRLKMMRSLHEVSQVAADQRSLLRGGPVRDEELQDMLKGVKITPGLIRNQGDLEKALNNLTTSLLRAYPGGKREVNAAFRAISELIGHWNAAINTLVEQLSRQVGKS